MGTAFEAIDSCSSMRCSCCFAHASAQAVVEETNQAFAHNVQVYTEEGALLSGAARGIANMVVGFSRAKLLGA